MLENQCVYVEVHEVDNGNDRSNAFRDNCQYRSLHTQMTSYCSEAWRCAEEPVLMGVNNMIANNWEAIVSTISAIGTAAAAIFAAVAVFQARKQLEANNKQSLFGMRVERWIKASGLLGLFDANKGIVKVGNKPVFAVDMYFAFLTNNSWLEETAAALKTPLEGEGHKVLLTKIESIRCLSMEVGYLFEGDAAIVLSSFVSSYAELLHTLYRYQILLGHMREAGDRLGAGWEEASANVGEPSYRDELSSAIEDATKAYDAFVAAGGREAIEAQIKLHQ